MRGAHAVTASGWPFLLQASSIIPFACQALSLLATNSLIPYSLSPRELGDRDAVEQQCQRLARLLLDGVRRRPAARPSRSPGKETA
jgi:hypothetical protein